MPDRINLTTTLGANTGRTTGGDVRLGRAKVLILTNRKFTAQELADSSSLKAAMESGMMQPRTSANKLFVIDGIREADDNTGDPNEATLGDGYSEILNEAVPKYVFRNTKGVPQQQSYAALNGWQGGAYFIDDKNLFVYRGDNGGAKPFSVGSYYANPPRPGNTGNINTNQIRFAFGDIDEFKSDIGVVKLDFNLSDLVNIVDVQLKNAGGSTLTALKVAAETKYAGTNIYEAYADALANKDAWKVTNAETGAAVAVSAVAKNATAKGWDLTKASGAGTFRVELVDPAALKALNPSVEGIESVYTLITVAP